MSEPLGATAAEWFHFDFELGLSKHLLPCVPAAPGVQAVEGSALEGKIGKIPSMFNGMGLAHGIKDWQKRPIAPEEVELWARDRRLNLCVRTGEISHVYAIDVDVELSPRVDEIWGTLAMELEKFGSPMLPQRKRANSNKFLLPFRMEDSCKKRIITVVPTDKTRGLKPQRIELLANGQQFVAAGTHSSGARYEWEGGLPSNLPLLTLSTLNNIWSTLESMFETAKPITTSSTSRTSPSTTTTPGEVLTEISEDDWNSLRQALRFMLDKVTDNDIWSEVGYALLSIKRSRPAAVLWSEFCSKAIGYVPGEPEKWWQAHSTQQPRSDYRHIFKLARGLGWSLSSSPDQFPIVSKVGGDGNGEAIDVAPPPLPERPIVQVADTRLVENIAQITALMKPEVYTQGNMLVRMGRENADEAIRRSADQLVFCRVAQGWTRVHLTDIAQFMQYDKKAESWVNTSCPAPLVLTWLDQTDWPILRPLDAIARAPFVRADGSICDTPGYDALSRALYLPSVAFEPVPTAPTIDDAGAALTRLLGPFDEFPWYTPASRSAFAAHILTEASRLALDRVPMFWYTAPDAGTGKTLLSESAAVIVHGSEPAVRPWVQDGDELRKTLFASLLAGDRSVAFDNVPTGYKARAPELCAFLTSSIWKDRKLGVSETHAVPNRAVVSASGNNVTPVGDLARRCLVVRLDANSEHMSARRFKISNLRAYLLQNRPALLVDALTIIRAHALARVTVLPVPLPSFENWSALVREPLIWLGLPDPCETQKDETDNEGGSLGDIFESLAKVFGEAHFTCVDVARMVGGMLDSNGELSSMMLNNGCQEPSSQLKVGYWLRSLRDKNAAGLKLVHAGNSKVGVKWRLKRLGMEPNMNEDLI